MREHPAAALDRDLELVALDENPVFVDHQRIRIKQWGLTRRFEYSYSPMELVTGGDKYGRHLP